uniref:TIL domain containing protein n=1 Tax=Rhipicephalus appendiculatus TaxID=34631 RepID=A0A131YET5_RHIAP
MHMPMTLRTSLYSATNMEAIPIFISLVVFALCASYALVAGQAQVFSNAGGMGSGPTANVNENETTTTTTTTTSTTKAPVTTHGLV